MVGGQSARILVVEDEVVVARDMQRRLERLGYQVMAAARTADEAIALATDRRPNLVLIDVHLEGRTDGIAAANVITTDLHIPIVFMTAHSDDETVERAKSAAPYGYLLKPIRSEELRVAVEVALHKHQLERQLKERERWFSTTLRSIADAVVSVGLDSRVSFMNPAAEFLTGVPAHQAIGRPVTDVLQVRAEAEPSSPHPLQRALSEKRLVEMPVGTLTNLCNGERRLISDSAAPVIADGEVLGAVMVFRDITEQRQLQEQLLVSDRLVSVGMLAAGVAHEINNPLTVIAGNLELLTISHEEGTTHSTPAEDERREQMLADMAEASRRIRDVVRDLNLFAYPSTLEESSIDVQHVLNTSLRMTRTELRHRAVLRCQFGSVPNVWGSESRLGQVFINLLVNAAHSLSGSDSREQWIRVASRTGEEGEAIVEFQDSGSGMSRATLERLFTPFFTTKPKGRGSGLGLSICHRIVSNMGGTIHVESEPGCGTLMRVTLPPAPIQQTGRSEAAGIEPATRRMHVLIVDDEPAVAQVLKRMLQVEHDVVTSVDPHSALAMIHDGVWFDAILCDLMMPGMNGMELYERLTRSHPTQAEQMVFMTGGCFTDRAAAFIARPTTKHLHKPLSLDSLRAVLNECAAAQ